jgi:CIC family chloride channel protein
VGREPNSFVIVGIGGFFAGVARTPVSSIIMVIGTTTYPAVVIMVIVTTLVTPPLLKWALADRKAATPPEDGT